jgi:hypothetical protein
MIGFASGGDADVPRRINFGGKTMLEQMLARTGRTKMTALAEVVLQFVMFAGVAVMLFGATTENGAEFALGLSLMWVTAVSSAALHMFRADRLARRLREMCDNKSAPPA